MWYQTESKYGPLRQGSSAQTATYRGVSVRREKPKGYRGGTLAPVSQFDDGLVSGAVTKADQRPFCTNTSKTLLVRGHSGSVVWLCYSTVTMDMAVIKSVHVKGAAEHSRL